jgi:hypothetical protein
VGQSPSAGVADLVEPLYSLMAERMRGSQVVATDDTIMPMLSNGEAANARMWVYVGDDAHPYNVFDFTLHRGRDGPKYFLKNYRQVLLADAYGGYNGVVAGNEIARAGCWSHVKLSSCHGMLNLRGRERSFDLSEGALSLANHVLCTAYRPALCDSQLLGHSLEAPNDRGSYPWCIHGFGQYARGAEVAGEGAIFLLSSTRCRFYHLL